ncbi:hypothetical protein CHLRE_03g172100v5 [Chlamydomonas reinhardtii]|uniref:Peptide deformylase n=1 Tax=Chlamydomonas reinhardtii TaxID=3055 RepID=A0A2K3DX46_CHLRE|nr:uncharacterized protein CHLRE_03g172100v5 [Chlamydomonas reinhardtii]PNW85109.1 hypothetical protein CHLRE_03g172100v5 [Chlamydomonas reinhardtii]
MATSPAPDAAKLRSIVQAGSPVLRQPAKTVPRELLGSGWLRGLAEEMTDVMRAAPGVGLAAPQIGEPWRVIVMEDRQEYMDRQAAAGVYSAELLAAVERRPFGPLVVVNPTLKAVGQEGGAFFEGCLSVRGYTAIVRRYREVDLEGVDVEGLPLRLRLTGWAARIAQHEVDHLAGVLYVDRMDARSLAAADNMPEWVRALPGGVTQLGRCACCHPINSVPTSS